MEQMRFKTTLKWEYNNHEEVPKSQKDRVDEVNEKLPQKVYIMM